MSPEIPLMLTTSCKAAPESVAGPSVSELDIRMHRISLTGNPRIRCAQRTDIRPRCHHNRAKRAHMQDHSL